MDGQSMQHSRMIVIKGESFRVIDGLHRNLKAYENDLSCHWFTDDGARSNWLKPTKALLDSVKPSSTGLPQALLPGLCKLKSNVADLSAGDTVEKLVTEIERSRLLLRVAGALMRVEPGQSSKNTNIAASASEGAVARGVAVTGPGASSESAVHAHKTMTEESSFALPAVFGQVAFEAFVSSKQDFAKLLAGDEKALTEAETELKAWAFQFPAAFRKFDLYEAE